MINLSNLPNCSCGLDLESSGNVYKTSNFFIVIILIPVTAFFGYFGNGATAFVYSRRTLRRMSSNVYLCALACSDLFVLSTGLCVIWLDSARGLIRPLDGIFGAQALPNLTLALIFQTTSVYITIFATIDAFIRVCGSNQYKEIFCRPKTAVLTVMVIVVGSLAFHLVRVWMLELRLCVVNDIARHEVCPTEFGMEIGMPYSLYATSLTMVIGPFFLLTVLTAIIINQTLRVSKGDKSPGSDSVSTLVLVALMFLFCNILTVVTTVVEGFLNVDLVFINYLADIGNYLVIFNASVNFLIYLRLDYAYRCEFVNRMCHVTLKPMNKAASFDQECQVILQEASANFIQNSLTSDNAYDGQPLLRHTNNANYLSQDSMKQKHSRLTPFMDDTHKTYIV